MPDPSKMKQVMEDYCRAETEKDKPTWMALFAEGAVHEDPVGEVRNEGLENISTFWDSFQSHNLEVTLTEPSIVCGDELICFMQARFGPANARGQSGRIVDQVIFNEDCKITAVRAFYDRSTW